MAKKLVAGPRRLLCSAVPFAGSVGKNSCSQPLTSQSLARAEKAELDGSLSRLDGELLCECGARVGAHRAPPWMGGPMGSPLVPTSHSVHKSPRRSAPAKVYQSKRSP
jgi:hypothetical protein